MTATQWTRQDLASDLLRRCAASQAVRRAHEPVTSVADYEAIRQVDVANTGAMRRVIVEVGWPGHSVVGEAEAEAAWQIAQHSDADPDFQRRARDLVAQAVEVGEATPQQMAYLIDRCCLNSRPRRPQVYGTQYIPGRRGLLLYAVEDPQRLDERRAAIGLKPFAEYDARMRGGAVIVLGPLR